MFVPIRLFVGNLPHDTQENDLKTAFALFGKVTTLEIKCKSDDKRNCFAFVTLSGSNDNVESCIKHFSTKDFKGSKLYVTRARESFMERLQRERLEAQHGEPHHKPPAFKKNPILNLGEKLNPRKRKIDRPNESTRENWKNTQKREQHKSSTSDEVDDGTDTMKQNSDVKRLESLKLKRQEFKKKKELIKSGLIGTDSKQNKKIIFSDTVSSIEESGTTKKIKIFEDDENDDDINFEIKNQYEGKRGQKVLDLQSKYKSDKRFVLDARFIEEEVSDINDGNIIEDQIDVGQTDEKTKQLHILQDVLGVSIKSNTGESTNIKKTKPKLGMLRFDPMQPEHAKFLAPVEDKVSKPTSKKKLKDKSEKEDLNPPEIDIPKIQVSKEQFYKVSETLKESIEQPTSFSLRSLFGNVEENEKNDDHEKDESSYIPIKPASAQRKKNPLNPGEKNPFVYDSSDSETEEQINDLQKVESVIDKTPVKHVWKENLFFTESDDRLRDGVSFFNKSYDHETNKERRELKSLMKKRIYNKERKTQMFQKKIGGRRKSMKKSFRKKH